MHSLDLLRIVDKKTVCDFTSSLKEKSLNTEKKIIIVIGTGGTISMRTNEKNLRIPELSAEKIFHHIDPNIQNKFQTLFFDLFHIDSSQISYDHIHDLVLIMEHLYTLCQDYFIGFVVLHGTDTMSYTSSAVSLMMGPGLPFSVIFTGAQKPIQEPMSDGANNLRNSIYTLEALYQRNFAEVVICMGDVALLATSSEKVDDEKSNAFAAPLIHNIARFDTLDYPIKLAPWLKERRPITFSPFLWSSHYSRTLVVKSYTGLNPDIIKKQVESPDIQALILYSYGAGTVDHNIIYKVIPYMKENNKPVFVVSPVNSEPKMNYPSGKDMIDIGVIPLFMTLPSALAKIEIALDQLGADIDKISSFMTTNYVGEIPSPDNRYLSHK